MTDSKIQKAPKVPPRTGAAGRRLWVAVLEEYELEEHEMALLREMVRTVDTLDQLAARVDKDGLMVSGPGASVRVHPAAVEARQQKIALARLAASLRLPAGEEGDEQKGARRPQRRSGARGVYGFPRAVSS